MSEDDTPADATSTHSTVVFPEKRYEVLAEPFEPCNRGEHAFQPARSPHRALFCENCGYVFKVEKPETDEEDRAVTADTAVTPDTEEGRRG